MVASAMADACGTREWGLRDEWILPQAPPHDYGQGANLPAVVAGILFNRGIRDGEIGAFLRPDVASMHRPALMRDMPEAVNRLRAACAAGETILVNGDFDVDGVTAALVLAETLEALGASVLVHFPDRDTDGHGLQTDTVDRYRAHGVSLIVTADCGSGSRAAAERARALGMDLVITDHHPPGAGPLPRALAVVNPRRDDCPYPFKDLSGAAVAFKVASMLVSDRPDAAHLRRSVLDVVALGVIADCVPLRGENRILVRYGLPLIGATSRPGLRSLIRTVLPGVTSLTAGDVARTIAPPLNAPGRMPVAGGARLAYDLLAVPRRGHAAPSIAQLLRVNEGRKEAVARVVEEARRMLGPAPDGLPLIAISQAWPVGILGNVAGRLSDAYGGRPVVVIRAEGGRVRASGRAQDGFDLGAAIAAARDLLVDGGGHPAAAGFTTTTDNLPRVIERLRAYAAGAGTAPAPVARVDTVVGDDADAPTLTGLYRDLHCIGPFGVGNPEPLVLWRGLIVRDRRIVGEGRSVSFALGDPFRVGADMSAVAFGRAADLGMIARGVRVDVVGEVHYSAFRRGPEVLIKDLALPM